MARIHTMPCPVCDDPCEVKFTHRGKPYWQCDPCKVQVFVRGREGIAKLRRRVGLPVTAQEEDTFWG